MKCKLLGDVCAPVPLSATNCGESTALSAILSDAVSVPAAAGLNSMEIMQLAPEAKVDVQVVVDVRKEVAFVPSIDSEFSINTPEPVFFTVTVCAAEVEPTVVTAKVKLAGDRLTDKAG
jgi:hypothetical protein